MTRLCSSRSTFLMVKLSFDHQWFWIYTVVVHKVHHKPYFSFFKIIITVLISVKWSKTFQKNQNFENFHVFWQILEKSYCCRWRYFFTDFSQKSFTTYRSNFNPKKQVFEAWKSSKIDHLDGRHQCKFIFSLFSWNFGKSFKTLNFSNSYPQNDESKSCKIDEIHKELLKKHPFYIIFDTFLQKYKATATIYFYETWSNRSSDRESNGSSHFDTFEPRKSWIQPTDAAPKNQFFMKIFHLQRSIFGASFLDF